MLNNIYLKLKSPNNQKIQILLKDNLTLLNENNITTILIVNDDKFINTEGLNNFLINHDNWAFHHFVPNTETNFKKNLLLLGFFDNFYLNINNKLNIGYKPNFLLLDDIYLKFKYDCIYVDTNLIIEVLIKEVEWDKTNLNNHSFIWFSKVQKFMPSFINFFLIDTEPYFPSHWGYPKNNKHKNLLFKNLIKK